jgi:assimilatory nitrate reductase catalytic subunit
MQTSAIPADSSTGQPVATHCPYCGFQCGMQIIGPLERAKVEGDRAFPVNKGGLCIKGWTAPLTLNHPERLRTPLARTAEGDLMPVSWDEALERIAEVFRTVQARYGPDAVGLFGSGALTNEKAYLLGKFARVALRTSQIDYNGRFCMSSAAAAAIRAFGIDRGLPFPLEDIAFTEAILLVGSNVAETMPPIMQYFEAQRARGGCLVTIDPRTSSTAQNATLHLRLVPGTDIALANGLLHILIRDKLIDLDYIRKRTSGFEQAKAIAATYWPERVERITGIAEKQLVQAAHILGMARSAMILSGRGAEQQSQGVNNVLAYINLALALGLPGRPRSGYGCLTGQGNGQGGREHGQKADQLPGYRKIDDPAARQHVAHVWGIDANDLPGPGKSAYEMLASIGEKQGIRALLVMGSNIVVSVPHALQIEQRLHKLDFLVVADFFLSETARLADVVLPVTQWAEEEGTMTNLEGRVILRRRVFAPPNDVRSEIEILCDLAQRLGKGEYFRFAGAREVFAELRRASAGGVADYSGITYEKIEQQQGVFWPCSSEEHGGTPRLFRQGFPTPDGRARFHAVHHQPPAEERDDAYPLYLTTGRLLVHYQSGTQTRRIARLNDLASEPCAEMHPATARRYGLSQGDRFRLITRRGSACYKANITTTIREDTVFVPFHWSGSLAINRLTNPALDPISRMPEFKVCAARIEPVEALKENVR